MTPCKLYVVNDPCLLLTHKLCLGIAWDNGPGPYQSHKPCRDLSNDVTAYVGTEAAGPRNAPWHRVFGSNCAITMEQV